MKYKLLTICVLISIVTGCNKKEILKGERHKIDGIVYMDDTVNPKAQKPNQFKYNENSKNHTASHYKLSNQPKVIWNTRIGQDALLSNLVVTDKFIYAINGKGVLNCLDKKTGKLIWNQTIAPQIKDSKFIGGMSYHDNILYIGTNINTFIAFDTKSKKILWKKELDNSVKSIPFYHNGKIVITTANNHTFILNALSGKLVSATVADKADINLIRLGTPVAFNNNVICVYSSGEIISFNISDGSINWTDILVSKYMGNTSTIIPNITASPIIIGNKCLIANSYSQMVLFDAESGVKIWQKNIGAISHPVVADDKWIFAICDNELVCFNLFDGSVIWKYDLVKLFNKKKDSKLIKWHDPLLINNQIWLFTNSGSIVKFDAKTGKYLSDQYIHHVRHITTPVIVDNVMYTIANGCVYAIK